MNESITLDPDQVEELRRLVGTVEDWLLHTPRTERAPGLTGYTAEAAQPRRIEVQGAGTPQAIEMSPGQGSAEPGSGDEQ